MARLRETPKICECSTDGQTLIAGAGALSAGTWGGRRARGEQRVRELLAGGLTRQLGQNIELPPCRRPRARARPAARRRTQTRTGSRSADLGDGGPFAVEQLDQRLPTQPGRTMLLGISSEQLIDRVLHVLALHPIALEHPVLLLGIVW